MKLLNLALALIVIVTASLSGMRYGGGGSRPNMGYDDFLVSAFGRETEDPYVVWEKKGANTSELSYDQVLVFVKNALIYGRGTAFKNVLSRVKKDDYAKVFTKEAVDLSVERAGIDGDISKDMLEKFKILAKALVDANDTIVLKRIQDGINEAERFKLKHIEAYKRMGSQELVDSATKKLESFRQAKEIINQTIAQAQREQK